MKPCNPTVLAYKMSAPTIGCAWRLVATPLLVAVFVTMGGLADGKTEAKSTPSKADPTRAVVPPIAAAVKQKPIPKEPELSLLLGNQVRQLLRARQTAYNDLASTKTGTARKLAAEISVLENRLAKGPDLKHLVVGITKQVEKMRELKALKPVSFEILDRKQMQDFVEDKLEEDMPPQGLRRSELLLKAVGGLPRTVNLRRVLVRMVSEQAAGLYDPATKKLYVASSFSLDKPISRIILAHEICHALQDQHFDLRSMIKKVAADDDQAMATMSVIEGDATQLMAEYAMEHLKESSPLDYAELLTQDQRSFRAAPFFLRQSLVFPYVAGQQYLIYKTFGSHEAIDEIFRNPPTSTEQIIESTTAIMGRTDQPTSVPSLALSDLGLTEVSRNTVGQFGIKTLFELWKVGKAADIAKGWDGDTIQVWAIDAQTTSTDLQDRSQFEDRGLSFSWVSVWDTEADAQLFGDELGKLFIRGPFSAELAETSSENAESISSKSEKTGTMPWLQNCHGKSAHLRVFRVHQKVAIILSHGNVRAILNKVDSSRLINHLGPIQVRD